MLLNELENKEHKLNRINKWLNPEFGFTVDTATPEKLAEVKKELEGVKVKTKAMTLMLHITIHVI